MSLTIIRAALEKKLMLLDGSMATSFENASITPTPGTPYQDAVLMPATPDNQIMGRSVYCERGIFQVSLMYPIGKGSKDAGDKAQALRAHFKRGTSLAESGLTVNIINTPGVSTGMRDGDRYRMVVSIPWECYVTT